MNDSISIVFPTRYRVNNVRELLETLQNTVKYKSRCEVCIYFDEDDVDTIEKCKEFIHNYEIKVNYIVGPRLVLSQLWNIAYEKLATGSIIMQCGDDIRFRTPDWDEVIYNAYNKVDDKILLVFGNDGIAFEKLATHSFVSRKWIEVSGMWLPPYFASDYNDVWLDEVARKIARIQYFSELYFEHMHILVNKAVEDNNTRERMARHAQQNPTKIYEDTAAERDQHAARLLKYIIEFK